MEYRASLLDQMKRKDSASWLRERLRRLVRERDLPEFRTCYGRRLGGVIVADHEGLIGKEGSIS